MKLASIEKIIKIEPIIGADRIELATIQGWDVVVSKGTYKSDDKCVYIPIDTQVDLRKPWFKILSNNPNISNNILRIKTLKIRGVWSQGLIIPLSDDIIELLRFHNISIDSSDDIGHLIGISKYQKDLIKNTSNKFYEKFPTDIISKTDEDNLKSKPEILQEFEGKKIYISKKLDGSSMTIILQNKNITVCSRNYILDLESDMSKFVLESGISNLLKNCIQDNIAIQGEFCGPKINSNRLGLKENHFYIFNIKNIDTEEFYGLDALINFKNETGLEFVPVLDIFEFDNSWTITKFQNYANNIKYSNCAGEGIVIRPIIPIWSKILNKNLSCKIINQNYHD